MPAKLKDEVILNDIKEVFKKHGPCSSKEYYQYGKYAEATIISHFKSYKNAIKILNLPYIDKTATISEQDLINDVLHVFKTTNNTTRENYLKYGKYSRAPIKRLFGTWNNLLKSLNQQLNMRKQYDIDKDEILKEMWDLYNQYGYLTAELQRSQSTYSQSTIEKIFGSFNNLLKEMKLTSNSSGARYSDSFIINKIQEIYKINGYISHQLILKENLFTKQALSNRFDNMQNLCEFCNIPNTSYRPDDTSHTDKVTGIVNTLLNEEPIYEKQFSWLINPVTNKNFRIDLYYPNHNIAIEVDGKEHYKTYKGNFYLSDPKDLIKQDLIVSHGIKLIRILWYENENEIKNKIAQVISA